MGAAESTLPTWSFRSAASSDLRRLYDVWYASVIATHDFLSQADLSDICLQVKNEYLPNNPLLVAVDAQDRVIGFMGLSGREIDSLFIDPSWRGKGLGRAFIEQASSGHPYIEVGVNAQNHQAIGFYEAVGFYAFTSSPTDDYGRPYPIVRMRLQLAHSE